MQVERRGAGSSLKKWTVQVWETFSPCNPGRRIVAAEFRREEGGEVEAVYRLTSADLTPVEAVQFEAKIFSSLNLWADLSDEFPGTPGIRSAIGCPEVHYLLVPA